MKPILFAITLPLLGEVELPAYFTLLTLGFALAMLITVREAKRTGLDHEVILDTNLWMVVWGIIGARALHLVADGHLQDYVNLCLDPKLVKAIDAKVQSCTTDAQCGYDYLCDAARHVCHPPRDCFAALEVWRGGLAYYGGFLFATAFAIWYLRRHRLSFFRVADFAAYGISLGLVFGRLGCFLNGCCYGKVTRSAVGVVFPRGGDAWRAQLEAGRIHLADAALPVHPTQLYESVACLVVTAILYFVWRPRKRADGEILAGLLILYGVARVIVEVFRDDERGVFFGGLISTSQLISVPLIGGGLYLIRRLRRRGGDPHPTANSR